MELVRVVATREQQDEVVALSRTHAVLVRCSNADTVMAVASWRSALHAPIGVWLRVGEDYPAQLAARDVATLAAIVPLERVVIDAPYDPGQHADVVRALLTSDEVTFTNDVATLRDAYNRPAPPREVDVWTYEGAGLRRGDLTLREGPSTSRGTLSLTFFEDQSG